MTDMIAMKDGTLILTKEFADKFVEFERQAAILKKQEDELKQAILEEMERRQLLKIENDDLAITYVAASNRESFDSKRFRADFPTVYDDYVRISKVSPSVRIKLK
jgi:regulator of replication initiation timing